MARQREDVLAHAASLDLPQDDSSVCAVPDGWPVQLAAPPAPEGGVPAAWKALEGIAGEFLVNALLCRDDATCAASLVCLNAELTAGRYNGAPHALMPLFYAARVCLDVDSSDILVAALTLLFSVVAAVPPTADDDDLASACQAIVWPLTSLLGDHDARLRGLAHGVVLHLAELPGCRLQSATAEFVRPVEQRTWPLVPGILELLQDLVPRLGIKADGVDGFDLVELMEFVNQAFTSPYVDVRAAAVLVVSAIQGIIGTGFLRRFIARDPQGAMLVLNPGQAPPPQLPSRSSPLKPVTDVMLLRKGKLTFKHFCCDHHYRDDDDRKRCQGLDGDTGVICGRWLRDSEGKWVWEEEVGDWMCTPCSLRRRGADHEVQHEVHG